MCDKCLGIVSHILILQRVEMTFSLTNGLSKAFKDFCENTHINGFRYLYLFDKFSYFWALTQIMFVCLTSFMASTLWSKWLENPTIVSLQSTTYPVNKVPFPAIAVCNANKISRRQITDFAKLEGARINKSYEEILHNIASIGVFYDWDVTDEFGYDHLIHYFQELDKSNKKKGFFDIRNLFKQLSTPCEEFISECSWMGKEENCTNIFQLRLTYEGYCCIFNYHRRTTESNETIIDDTYRVLYGEYGTEKGLKFKLYVNIDDYYYTSMATAGFSIQVFKYNDYADVPSGGLVEALIGSNEELFIRLVPKTLHTVRDVIQYPISTRKCYFPEEKHSAFGIYSYSNCLVECRLRSIYALCNCVPFMYPILDPDLVCTPVDLPCLGTHKYKWSSHYPVEIVKHISLAKEDQNSLRCPGCYPECDAQYYDIKPDSYTMSDPALKNFTLVTVHFLSHTSSLYIQDVKAYWFEGISTFGGLFGLMMGFSQLGLLEIFVYFIIKTVSYAIKS